MLINSIFDPTCLDRTGDKRHYKLNLSAKIFANRLIFMDFLLGEV